MLPVDDRCFCCGRNESACSGAIENPQREEVSTVKYVAPSYMVAEPVGDVTTLVTPAAYAVVAVIVIVALVVKS